MQDNVKKRSIRAQISRTLMTVAIIAILILGITAASALMQMRSQTLEINSSMGSQAAKDSRAILESEAKSQLTALAMAKAETVDANILSIMSQVDILASSAQALYAEPDNFGRVEVLAPDAANQGKFVGQIVYAKRTPPESVADEVGLIGNLIAQMNGTSEFLAGAGTTQIGTESGFIIMCDENSGLKTGMDYLDPVERGWYRMAADGGDRVWSDVFEDSYGRGLAVTCGKPVYGENNELKAVISIGSTLDDIGTSVTELSIGQSGYAFVVSRNGDVIMSKNLVVDSSGHVIGTRNLLNDQSSSIRAIAERIAQGENGVEQVDLDGSEVFLAYEPMKNMPWTVITVMSVDEVLAPARQGEIEISKLSETAGEDILKTIRKTALMFIVATAVAIAAAVWLSRITSARITEPLSQLTKKVEDVSGGNLDERIELHTGDEIETLAEAFNRTTASLKQYIGDLTAVTAEKERIGAELDVATHIQASMLPSIFPAFPEREEFDIYATMDPAKEVGGDFYDFFMVDDRHLAIVVADVSGKGVPAALFMVIGKTLIKDHTQPGCDLTQVFSDVNNLLCESNSEGLFITAFEGVLDLVTGEFIYVNAGHETPYICKKNGVFEPHEVESGFVLAGLEDMEFFGGSMMLEPGDKIFQYTDGVPEAINVNEELYGEERLTESLRRHSSLSPQELLPAIKADIDSFVGEADQFDDITMLCLTYEKQMIQKAVNVVKELTIEATVENIIPVTEFVDKQLEALGCPMTAQMEIDVAIDELFGNIANYAYDPEVGPATVRVEVGTDPLSVIISFIDNGVPYNPLEKDDPDITLSAEERDIGGLGIFMVKQSMDSIDYEYKNGQNILTIKKKIEE